MIAVKVICRKDGKQQVLGIYSISHFVNRVWRWLSPVYHTHEFVRVNNESEVKS